MCMGGVCTCLQPQRKRPLAHVMPIKRQRWGRWPCQCCNMVHLTATVTSSHCSGRCSAASSIGNTVFCSKNHQCAATSRCGAPDSDRDVQPSSSSCPAPQSPHQPAAMLGLPT